MRTLLLAAALVSCGKREEKPLPTPASGVPAKTDTIALPIATGDPVGTATTYLRYVHGAIEEISAASVFGDRSRPFHGLAADGTLTSAANGFSPASAHEPFPMASPTALFVDRATLATELRTVLGSQLRGRCWGFAVADHGKLALMLPDPCPPAPRVADEVNLDVYVTTSGRAAAHVSSPKQDAAFATLDELSAFLVKQKAQPFFGGRTDLALAVEPSATVGELVEVLARARAAGFVSAAWVDHASEELRALTR